MCIILALSVLSFVASGQHVAADECSPQKPITILIDQEMNLNLKCPETPLKCPEPPTCPPPTQCPEPPKCPEPPACPELSTTTKAPGSTTTHETSTSTQQFSSCRDIDIALEPRVVIKLIDGPRVMCDVDTDGGGWLVIQRRTKGDLDFYRDWNAYRAGFGNISDGDFWLGNDLIHNLTFSKPHELRVDLKFGGKHYYAKYSHFRVFGEEDKYKLEISGYTGTAGDSLAKQHNGMPFTTKDRDNDPYGPWNCAEHYQGAWWYNQCHTSNLNGRWGSKEYGLGLQWRSITDLHNTVTFSEMKIRPVD